MMVMVRVDRYVDGESRSSHIMETRSLTRIAIQSRYKYDHHNHNREFYTGKPQKQKNRKSSNVILNCSKSAKVKVVLVISFHQKCHLWLPNMDQSTQLNVSVFYPSDFHFRPRTFRHPDSKLLQTPDFQPTAQSEFSNGIEKRLSLIATMAFDCNDGCIWASNGDLGSWWISLSALILHLHLLDHFLSAVKSRPMVNQRSIQHDSHWFKHSFIFIWFEQAPDIAGIFYVVKILRGNFVAFCHYPTIEPLLCQES